MTEVLLIFLLGGPMLPYEFYKFLHVMMIFVFLSGAAIGFFIENNPKWNKILTGVTSVLIFVAGMGLLARIGVQHGSGFPGWVWLKMGLWLVMAVGAPVLAKRCRQYQTVCYFGILTLTAIAAWAATYKPFESI
jgi:uncharacterized membrane protein SirB2